VILLALLASLWYGRSRPTWTGSSKLYVVGVFTSFTLSQTGMVRHWLKIKRSAAADARGWRRSMVINAIGATATFVVLIIVVRTKFLAGAWIVIAAMPVIHRGLLWHPPPLQLDLPAAAAGSAAVSETARNTVILYVEDLNAATARAVGYVRAFRGRDYRAVPRPARLRAVGYRAAVALLLPDRGGAGGPSPIPQPGRRDDRVPARHPSRGGRLHHGGDPGAALQRSLLAAIRRRSTFMLKVRLLSQPQVVITDVPVLEEPGKVAAPASSLIPERVEVMVFISAVHDATVRAVNYARSLRMPETRAVFFAMDESEIEEIQRGWQERRIPIALDIVEAPFRDLTARCWRRSAGSHRGRTRSRRSSCRSWSFVSGGTTSCTSAAVFIKRLLLFEPGVILSSVPFQLH